jgi:hexosaminidase
MDPTNEATYKLLEVFFKEMAALFPDRYLHIGGDENEGKQWAANPRIQAFMKEKGIKNQDALQQYFNQRILKFLQKNGKIMMGWDEIFQPEMPKEIVIQSWRGQESLAKVARQGNQGILSNGYYIDLNFPASQHYVVDPIPADTTLTAEEQKRILGGEATMWSEWVSPETIDSRIWTRTAAIAERLWSPREINDVDDMYRRLDVVSAQLEELGLTHRKNQAILLRRLTNNQDITALQTLVSVIEPVKEYRRYQVRPQSMLSPLTGLIDAAQADAPGAREFNKLIQNYAKNKDFRNALIPLSIFFANWKNSGAILRKQIEKAPALMEANQLAADLESLGEIGSESAGFFREGKKSSAEWRDEKLKRLDEIAKQKAGLEFQVIESMKILVNATAEN